jgi:hypothetical protein
MKKRKDKNRIRRRKCVGVCVASTEKKARKNFQFVSDIEA